MTISRSHIFTELKIGMCIRCARLENFTFERYLVNVTESIEYNILDYGYIIVSGQIKL